LTIDPKTQKEIKMGHIPEDNNVDEFMNASAEEWSKPSKPPAKPDIKDEQVDRWGSPISKEGSLSDQRRWGSEPSKSTSQTTQPPTKKGGTKWWIIVLVVVLVLCLCGCLVLFGLPWFGIEIFQGFSF
jgi:hypothetical protein